MKTSCQLLFPLVFASLFTACGPSLATLHEDALAGRVEDGAPLHARQSITIFARAGASTRS